MSWRKYRKVKKISVLTEKEVTKIDKVVMKVLWLTISYKIKFIDGESLWQVH